MESIRPMDIFAVLLSPPFNSSIECDMPIAVVPYVKVPEFCNKFAINLIRPHQAYSIIYRKSPKT